MWAQFIDDWKRTRNKRKAGAIDVIGLFEDLAKHLGDDTQRDALFYEAPEGDVQIDIVAEMIQQLLVAIGRKEGNDESRD